MSKLIVSTSMVIYFLVTAVGCSQSNPSTFISDNKKNDEPEMMNQAINDNAVQNEAAKAEYHKISAKEAKIMLDGGSEIILLDVRTEDEFRSNRINGAILLPDYEVEERASEILPNKDAVILVYCRSGNRSRGAANILVTMGYTNVYDFGGIDSWSYGTERD